MEIFKTNDIEVFYEDHMDGGGASFGQEYIQVIKNRYNKKFNNCLEWCSGPGFIGFSLLSNNLCNNISFLEFYKPAINYLEYTKKNNKKYSDKIKIFHSNSVKKIPKEEKYDLIVGNPPHFASDLNFLTSQTPSEAIGNTTRISVDINWNTHKDFFKRIKKNLSKDGVILLQENRYGSNVQTFMNFIESYDLQVTDAFFHENSKYDKIFYYLEIKHKHLCYK
jgi:tRNA1(Val) A37 N6-methylase TrmN6